MARNENTSAANHVRLAAEVFSLLLFVLLIYLLTTRWGNRGKYACGSLSPPDSAGERLIAEGERFAG